MLQEEEFRDYEMEGRRQHRELYQNVDFVADRPVACLLSGKPGMSGEG